METFNNTTKVVKDDLVKKIKSGSKVSIAAACFSIYAYQVLKDELEGCDEFRFIFTSPTFVAEKTQKERKEFYIPRLKREKSLYGTEFEVRLRNELKQKAVARECTDWMKRKASFRSNTTREGMNNFLVVENPEDAYTYMPMNSFTTVDGEFSFQVQDLRRSCGVLQRSIPVPFSTRGLSSAGCLSGTLPSSISHAD